jgi:DNA gyrase/topoisomerase IV subunit A
MAKSVPKPLSSKAILLSSSKLILRDSRSYAIYVCSTRAIPAVEDGMKFGQRVALWLLRNRAEKLKTFALSGLMGYERLYVHGETSANNAINLLAAPYKNNVPLIQGEGAFGSRIAPVEGIGAPRYTEVVRSKAAQAFFYNDLDLIPLEENYDGSNLQPKHFLPLIPVVLLNGVKGVAVGWSTNILPRQFKALVQATQDALNDRPVKQLIPTYERYDISVKNVGPNQWVYTGKAKIIDTSTIYISELPPGMELEDFRERLIAMEDSGEIKGFTDESADGIKITIKMLRGSLAAQPASVKTETIEGKVVKTKVPARKAWTDADAVEFFKLHQKVTERIVVIDWGGTRIKQYESAEDVVKEFVAWRLQWYVNRYEKMRDDASYELNYYLALKALFKDTSFTSKLGKFPNRAGVVEEVTTVIGKAKIVLDESQMSRVVSLPTYRWTKEYEAEVTAIIEKLKLDIKEYKDILAKPARRKDIYNTELEELKKLKL